MPKIEVNESLFFELVGRRWSSREEFEDALSCAKAELDEDADSALKEADRILKIELNDTNRPDLWSTAGCARQLRLYSGAKSKKYDFFSNSKIRKEPGQFRVIVDKELQLIRPFIAAFVVSGKAVDEVALKDLIQTQEKLCWNFGRKRRSIAMGIYRTSLIQWPVKYFAADPEITRFVPLGSTTEMSLRDICSKHPKGQEYGHIVANFNRFPYLTDNTGETLSFPPVINSARIGAIEIGDTELFVEMTGTDLYALTLAANMVACDFSDLGYSIKPVQVEYPYDTPFGRNIVFPYYFQEPTFCSLARIERFLGDKVDSEECIKAVQKMGCRAEEVVASELAVDKPESGILLFPPEYRNDFLHAADVVEDVMIGRSMKSFSPLHPRDFTIGRLLPITMFSRKVKEALIGLGYQEMIYNYLGSKQDFVEKMRSNGDRIIRVANPMSENFEFIRDSIIPCLLMSEAVSANAVFPHRIFEVGKVLIKDESQNYGASTNQYLGFLQASADTNFNNISSQIQTLMYYLSKDYEVAEVVDERFISGRVASIVFKGKSIGVFGELHPQVLTNWGISIPCSVAEICLDALI